MLSRFKCGGLIKLAEKIADDLIGTFISHGLLKAENGQRIKDLIVEEIARYGKDRCKFQRAICANIFLSESDDVHKKILHAEEPKL